MSREIRKVAFRFVATELPAVRFGRDSPACLHSSVVERFLAKERISVRFRVRTPQRQTQVRVLPSLRGRRIVASPAAPPDWRHLVRVCKSPVKLNRVAPDMVHTATASRAVYQKRLGPGAIQSNPLCESMSMVDDLPSKQRTVGSIPPTRSTCGVSSMDRASDYGSEG